MNLPLFENAQLVISSGGIIMIPLFVLSFFLYRNLVALLYYIKHIYLDPSTFRDTGDIKAREPRASFPLSSMVHAQIHPSEFDFEELQRRLRNFVHGRLNYIHAMLIAAPLIGLLGTVTGMLTTFHGLSMQAGHETASTVADGVSRALITTQTGLMIAIPGLFFSMWIRKILRDTERRILDIKVTYRNNSERETLKTC